MPEHRGGISQKGLGEDQGQLELADPAAPCVELRAGSALAVHEPRGGEEAMTGREATAGVPGSLRVARAEGLEGRGELVFGIPRRAQEEPALGERDAHLPIEVGAGLVEQGEPARVGRRGLFRRFGRLRFAVAGPPRRGPEAREGEGETERRDDPDLPRRRRADHGSITDRSGPEWGSEWLGVGPVQEGEGRPWSARRASLRRGKRASDCPVPPPPRLSSDR